MTWGEKLTEGYPDLDWKVARSGSLYARTRDGHVLIVYQREDRQGRPKWGWVVKRDGEEEPVSKESGCNNEAEAKRAAWHALEDFRKQGELPFDAA